MSRWPAAIVWDLDGTLLDSAPDLGWDLNTVLRDHGCTGLDPARVRSMIGGGVAKLVERGFRAAGASLDQTETRQAIARFMEIYSANATRRSRLYPGARKVLKQFSAAGIRQAICTNKPESISRKILAELAIADQFEALVGGDTCAAKKPDPRPLRSCLEALKTPPSHGLMVGDTEVDVATARALQMPVAIVSFGYARQAVSSLGADFLIDTLSSLPAAIASR